MDETRMAAANGALGASTTDDVPRTRGGTLAFPEQHRSAGVDVIRGICVLLVVLHHIHLRFKLEKFE